MYGILEHTDKDLLIISKSEAYSKKLSEMLSFFNVDSSILWEREFNFYNIDAGSHELFINRINCLYNKINKTSRVFIVTLDALSQVILPKEILTDNRINISVGMSVNLDEILNKLILLGYKRADMVESFGQFSQRGGVLDIYSPLSDNPYRIELFGDEVDSIRIFDEKTQLSYEKVSEIIIPVAGEIIFDNEKKEKIIKSLKGIIKKNINTTLKENIKADIERINNEGYFYGIDKYIDLIYENSPTFLDYFNKNETIILFDEPLRISEKKNALMIQRGEMITSLIEKNIVYNKFDFFKDIDEIINSCFAFPVLGLSNILTGTDIYKPDLNVNISVTDTPSYYGKLNLFAEDIINYEKKGYTIVIPVPASKADNFKSFLSSSGIIINTIDENDKPPEKGVFLLSKKGVMGFNYVLQKFILMYDSSIFGDYKAPVKKKKKDSNILSFTDLKIGDYVVHNIHGIGQYVGNEKLAVENVKRDYLKIKYYGTDYLYVPANQLDNLNKYVGVGEGQVRLNRLGGQEFNRIKSKVKSACADLADKLILLYAEREKAIGHAYGPDTDMQVMFEQTFPYTETEDQLRSIAEVKADMESTRPMDRLICGDVGYGKTEVALRAAFKCAAEGKQTAYLASTTVLAQQHYNTFKSRMEDFPIKVSMLSRFKTKKEQNEIIKNLKNGTVDIVIGTHRLLSKDIEFKDLGLLIVDEEQRFGVEHKERLKEMKKNIDVLTLTATPIPRTLHMSLIGIRDMSVLKEPPSDRFPVQTYVLEYNESIIKDAISKEISRGGQVFYLYNNVERINKVASKIKGLCPEANVAVVHGQMNEKLIENTFIKMLNGEIDVLVCTTIIETGIDIANANTIIVENSDTLGLSTLYQLRGRVGRSNRLAYCYLTYKKNKSLTEQQENRLKAIKEFTEFGSGFKIALRDLEIRGAGNVLGAQQHGHMDMVGYDMYLKILKSAIKEKQGEKVKDEISCRVDIKENAYIPENYITNHDIRMDIYKKISAIKTEKDVSDIIDELIDRFSEIPNQVMNLIDIAFIKSLAESVGIIDITDSNNVIIFLFNDASYLDFNKISNISDKYKGQILLNVNKKPGFSYKISKNQQKDKLYNIKNILQLLK